MADKTARRRGRGTVQDVDRHVGRRIRERRTMLGLTQQQLAERIGVTYQQAHKYETGDNRVSAGRLYRSPRRSTSSPATSSRASGRNGRPSRRGG